ncbi:hypothetical protein NPIL_37261 [Nephila pilipes]|uniref:Uncharacterized protein n=1 Tax=Nephila pilipes TaxID=299642 RepID=A0A8X6UA24_NEPPI|nr:hypothetical protein NPIL_37261 [Nephila pilipes]
MFPQKPKSRESYPDSNFRIVAHSSLKLSFPREQKNNLLKNTQTDTKISVRKGDDSKRKKDSILQRGKLIPYFKLDLGYLKIKRFAELCYGKHLSTRNFAFIRGGKPQLRMRRGWRAKTEYTIFFRKLHIQQINARNSWR